MDGTTNVRIRWVGSKCYMALNLIVEPKLTDGDDFDTYPGDWPSGEGFYVLRGTYQPCGGVVSFSHLIGVTHPTVAVRG